MQQTSARVHAQCTRVCHVRAVTVTLDVIDVTDEAYSINLKIYVCHVRTVTFTLDVRDEAYSNKFKSIFRM